MKIRWSLWLQIKKMFASCEKAEKFRVNYKSGESLEKVGSFTPARQVYYANVRPWLGRSEILRLVMGTSELTHKEL